MQNSAEHAGISMRNSQLLRLLLVGIIALLLQIPIAMIDSLVSERQGRQRAAVSEVSDKWGKTQSIAGPALVVPYTYRWRETLANGQQAIREETRSAIFLPEQLRARGAVDSEVRKRGIYSVPVYKLLVTLEGEFTRPDLAQLGLTPAAIAWERAYLAIGISDVRAFQEETAVTWNGEQIPFLPGTNGFTEVEAGIHAIVGSAANAGHIKFSIPLSLNGSVGVNFAPFGQTTAVELRSNYVHPSFQGNWLPTERTISSAGFLAKWSIPFLGRNYPQAWKAENPIRQALKNSFFGVDLINPVDHYQMARRSVKYAALFIFLTFAAIWLIEVLAAIRVHPIQYLMLGGALCLFYLLELSLSEHLGFPAAYTLASGAIIVMVAAYGVAVLHRISRGLFVGLGIAALYAYLYILLMNEDYALLIGSLGLFLILAAIMFITRRVDWYATGQPDATSQQSALESEAGYTTNQ